jgi:regulator of CtrA degradation
MTAVISAQPGTAPTKFFSKTYDETVQLLVASRDYIAYADPASAPGLTPLDRLRLNCETMRLTARLSQVMAWLLVQKAVFAGEISRDEAQQERFRLSEDAICFEESDLTVQGLPVRLRELLARSRLLYLRVSRLDDMARKPAE